MSRRFVRASSYRHVFGAGAKVAFEGTKIYCSGDGNHIAGNSKYFCYAPQSGGGGPVVVLDIANPRRLTGRLPQLIVHKAKVLDFAWNPFNDSLLATGGEDMRICMSAIPEGGLTSDLRETVAEMKGHEKKVTQLLWHPTANNILASGSFDKTVKVWDVSSQSVAYQCGSEMGHTDAIQHIAWNRDGSLLASTCKDKKTRVFDPRDAKSTSEFSAFDGAKKSSCVWLTNLDQPLLACVGFTKRSMRQVKLYDPRDWSKALEVVELGTSAGVHIPFYDHDNSILYLGCKGEGVVKYFEVTQGGKKVLHYLTAFSDTSPNKGLCFLPKNACDTTKCEIAHCLRIMRNSVIPTSFCVPRKSGADMFQSDIFPDTASGSPPALQSADYLDGKNADPILTSMDPEQRTEAEATEFVAKKTYAELEAELAAAYARIKELEEAQAA